MSAREEEVIGEVETNATEGKEKNSVRVSADLVDEKIKASLEFLHAQISALTEMMDRLIQSKSARETTAANTYETRYQYELPSSGALGAPRFPTVSPLTIWGHSPNTGQYSNF